MTQPLTPAPESAYDSRPETEAHIAKVADCLLVIVGHLAERARTHDLSKLREPEKSGFDYYMPRLKQTPYGSEEYAALMREMDLINQHHYAANAHHPQHHANGIAGMTLVDLVEMFADWVAASDRPGGQGFYKSLAYSADRFEMPDLLVQIFENTARALDVPDVPLG